MLAPHRRGHLHGLLPVELQRGQPANLIWAHKRLSWKTAAYNVRWQQPDLLVIERSGHALVGINDGWSTWRDAWVPTDFPRGSTLHDYSGANTGDVQVNGDGFVRLFVPPCDGSNPRRCYAVWGPTNVTGGVGNTERATTQEWELADDLGDSHAKSLGQGGALPARSTAPRTAGRIFADAARLVTVDLYPSDATQPLGIDVVAMGTVVATASGVGHLAVSYTPSAAGWLTLRVRHGDDKTGAQVVRVKATYTAPRVVDTALFPSLGDPVLGPPDLAMARDLGVDLAARDLAAPDLAVPDLGVQDLAARDVAVPDFAPPRDLVAPRDQATANDLSASPDLWSSTDAGKPADLATADLSLFCDLKVNEVQTAGAQGASDEFVEIYNPCPGAIALAGYKLVYRSAAGAGDTLLVALPGQLAPGAFLVAGNAAFSGKSDAQYANSISATGGGIAIRNGSGTVVDAVGWGTATNAFIEQRVAPAPAASSSIIRLPDGRDSDDNAADLTVTQTPTPGAPNR